MTAFEVNRVVTVYNIVYWGGNPCSQKKKEREGKKKKKKERNKKRNTNKQTNKLAN